MSTEIKDSSTESRQRRYIEAKLSKEDKIIEIRDDLFERLPVKNKYRKSDPHITIIPPFTIPESHVHDIHRDVEELNFEGTTVTVNGASVWPSLQNPRVVLLDVSVDLDPIRDKLMNSLEEYEADLEQEPVNAHITLFQCDNGYTIPETAKDYLQECIMDYRESWELEIQYIDIPCIHENCS